jgi:hypothetical protein
MSLKIRDHDIETLEQGTMAGTLVSLLVVVYSLSVPLRASSKGMGVSGLRGRLSKVS